MRYSDRGSCMTVSIRADRKQGLAWRECERCGKQGEPYRIFEHAVDVPRADECDYCKRVSALLYAKAVTGVSIIVLLLDGLGILPYFLGSVASIINFLAWLALIVSGATWVSLRPMVDHPIGSRRSND